MKSILESIKEQVRNMRPVSANTSRILNLVTANDYHVRDLAKLIGMDVTLSTLCLSIVNSSAFGLRTTINSVERAVSYLGRNTILNMVINLGFNGIYSEPLEGYEGERGVLWDHSLRTAIAARLVAQSTSQGETADVAYTAGLLHDIGKIIIAHFLAEQSSGIIENFAVGEENDFNSAELQLLQTDHTEVGYMMADHWGIPEPLKMAIRYHHMPGKAPEEFKKLCFVVHVGDILAMLGGCGTGCDTLAYRVDPDTDEFLSINKGLLEKLLNDIDSEYRESLTTTLNALEESNV